MTNLPERIEQLALQHAAKAREVQDLREQISQRESAATLEILNARDEVGRPLYTNETARNAALKLALTANTRYAELERRLETADTERTTLLANLERARNEFRLYLLDRQAEIAAMNSSQ